MIPLLGVCSFFHNRRPFGLQHDCHSENLAWNFGTETPSSQTLCSARCHGTVEEETEEKEEKEEKEENERSRSRSTRKRSRRRTKRSRRWW